MILSVVFPLMQTLKSYKYMIDARVFLLYLCAKFDYKMPSIPHPLIRTQEPLRALVFSNRERERERERDVIKQLQAFTYSAPRTFGASSLSRRMSDLSRSFVITGTRALLRILRFRLPAPPPHTCHYAQSIGVFSVVPWHDRALPCTYSLILILS